MSYTHPNLKLYDVSSSQKEIFKCFFVVVVVVLPYFLRPYHYIVALKIDNFANYAPKLLNTQPIDGSHFCQYFKKKIQYVYFYLRY